MAHKKLAGRFVIFGRQSDAGRLPLTMAATATAAVAVAGAVNGPPAREVVLLITVIVIARVALLMRKPTPAVHALRRTALNARQRNAQQ